MEVVLLIADVGTRQILLVVVRGGDGYQLIVEFLLKVVCLAEDRSVDFVDVAFQLEKLV